MNDNKAPDTPLALKDNGDPAQIAIEQAQLKQAGWTDYTICFYCAELQQGVVQYVTAASLKDAILGCAQSLAGEFKLDIRHVIPVAAFPGTPESLSIAAAFGYDPAKEEQIIEGTCEKVCDETIPTINADTPTKGSA